MNLNLSTDIVRLELLTLNHAAAIQESVKDGDLWTLTYTNVPHPDDVEDYIEAAIEQQRLGLQLPFVVIKQKDNQVVGATRYYEIDKTHRRLAIGYTWYRQSAQRTAVNTHTKFLLLKEAFDVRDCIAVVFHTDVRNVRSQKAIERLGAQREGVLRQHKIMRDGFKRDTVCYSILDQQWHACKKQLQKKL